MYCTSKDVFGKRPSSKKETTSKFGLMIYAELERTLRLARLTWTQNFTSKSGPRPNRKKEILSLVLSLASGPEVSVKIKNGRQCVTIGYYD